MSNNDSLVIRFAFAGTALLTEGDAERKSERQLATKQRQADVLEIAHNGSTTSTTPELLKAVHPRVAVISVGAHNTFGHPRLETLQRSADAGVAVYRSDLNGAVSLYLNGTSISSTAGEGPQGRFQQFHPALSTRQ